MSKLTKKDKKRQRVPDKIIKQIRTQYKLWSSRSCSNPPKNRQHTLAKKFGLSIGTINNILNNKGAYKNG